jgi:hypothetical protein
MDGISFEGRKLGDNVVCCGHYSLVIITNTPSTEYVIHGMASCFGFFVTCPFRLWWCCCRVAVLREVKLLGPSPSTGALPPLFKTHDIGTKRSKKNLAVELIAAMLSNLFLFSY